MPSRLEFQFTLPGVSTTPVRRDPDAPLHLLVMADFSGRGHRETPAALLDLTQRSLMTVDADNFNAVMARLAPKLRLPLDADHGTPLTLGFGQIDDFHPDALYQRLELFQALRRARARLLNPASFTQAVAELNASPVPFTTQEPASPAPTVTSESDSDLLERLLGRAPAAASPPRPTDPGAAAIQTLLQAVVQPHIVRSDPSQPAWIAAVDAAISDQMRAILHQPIFQALEAAWRGVYHLVATFDPDVVRVSLLDVTQQELLLDLRAAAGDPRATSLYTSLIDQGVRMHDGQPWTVLVGDYRFGTTVEDLALLGALGALGAYAGGPFLAAADPNLLGCESAAVLADPTKWTPPPAELEDRWRLLRSSAVAPWLGLALPRVLLRLPYGFKTDPVEQFTFEEMPGGRDPEAYLWGNPALVCARLIVAAFAEHGEAFSPGDVLEFDDFPAHVYEEADERVLQPATETLLGERAMQAVLARGLMPLLGHRQRNAVRLVRFQSLAEPAAALAGAWR